MTNTKTTYTIKFRPGREHTVTFRYPSGDGGTFLGSLRADTHEAAIAELKRTLAVYGKEGTIELRELVENEYAWDIWGPVLLSLSSAA